MKHLLPLLILCSGCTMTHIPGYLTRISTGQAMGFSVTITDPDTGLLWRLDYGNEGGGEAFRAVGAGIGQGITSGITGGK